jgi:hypothetical protein
MGENLQGSRGSMVIVCVDHGLAGRGAFRLTHVAPICKIKTGHESNERPEDGTSVEVSHA